MSKLLQSRNLSSISARQVPTAPVYLDVSHIIQFWTVISVNPLPVQIPAASAPAVSETASVSGIRISQTYSLAAPVCRKKRRRQPLDWTLVSTIGLLTCAHRQTKPSSASVVESSVSLGNSWTKEDLWNLKRPNFKVP